MAFAAFPGAMFRRLSLFVVFNLIANAAISGEADSDHVRHERIEDDHIDLPNLWTGEGMSIGGILFPSINFATAFGTSTADDPASLAVGHHDPDRDGWTIQNVEFSLEARLGEHVHAFVLYAAKIDLDDHWDDHFEEYYLMIDKLPGDLGLRAGRFYTIFGFQNNRHPHDFDWVDQYLMNGRFMGDDALTVYGGEVSLRLPWSLPAGWSDRLTASLGAVPDAEEHEHGHGHEESEEPAFEPEGALLQDWLANVDYTARYNYSKNHQFTVGASAAFGKNNFERSTQIYGLHAEYRWSENGPDEDGRWFVWRTEVALRHFGARSIEGSHSHSDEGHGAASHDEAEHDDAHESAPSGSSRHDFTDAGFYTTAMYGWSERVALQARAEWVSGTEEVGLDERWRLSPGVTWRPVERLDLMVRAQYNFDHSSAFGTEHSVWTQFVIGWGGAHDHEH